MTGACLYFSGNFPSLKDRPTNLAINGANVPTQFLITDVGILPNGDDLAGIELISLQISSTDGGKHRATMPGVRLQWAVNCVIESQLDDVLYLAEFFDEELRKTIAQLNAVVDRADLAVSVMWRMFRIADQRLRGSAAAICMDSVVVVTTS